MSGGIVVNNNVKFDSIVFCFQKNPVNSMSWLHNLLNTFYGQKMSQDKCESIFTTNAKDTLKADALDILDDWILEQAQMASIHGADYLEARTMKDLLKKETSWLVVIYGTGDWEQLDTTDDLKEYMNHSHVAANHHINPWPMHGLVSDYRYQYGDKKISRIHSFPIWITMKKFRR